MLENAKYFPDEVCTAQQRLLVSNFRLRLEGSSENWYEKKWLWKIKDPSNRQRFRDVHNEAFDEKDVGTETYDGGHMVEDKFLHGNVLKARN